MNQPCPIRGHDHELIVVTEHTQYLTGDRATTWECPSGRYRWFHIHKMGFTPANRQTRPRWGWPKRP